jgi:N-acetylneuraminic acid mutarotase
MKAAFIMLVAGFMSGNISAQAIPVEPLPGLPKAISNNAVTLVESDEGAYLFSFLGLGSGKTWKDISSSAFVLNPGATSWTELEPVPGKKGRLAASAVSAGGAAWLFGGYTVAADGSEESVAGVYRIRPGESALKWVTDMPVPVEDSVLLVYQDRYIYLVSGWHDLGNVNLVQVLDTQGLSWSQATPWPGTPVFGQAGGISDNQMLICDGVRIQYPNDESPRQFLPSKQCWAGKIAEDNHRRIHWRSIPSHPGAGRYRMAVTGDSSQRVIFAGGSVNPYNFNGTGYDGVPSEAEKSVFGYSFATGDWMQHGDLPRATMDHRGLLYSNGLYYLVGGMQDQQKVVTDVYRFRIE